MTTIVSKFYVLKQSLIPQIRVFLMQKEITIILLKFKIFFYTRLQGFDKNYIMTHLLSTQKK